MRYSFSRSDGVTSVFEYERGEYESEPEARAAAVKDLREMLADVHQRQEDLAALANRISRNIGALRAFDGVEEILARG